MADNSTQKTPNDVLSEIILARLREEALINENDADVVGQKLKSGAAKAADWNRWAERKLDRKLEADEQ
jgi:hypothetical protein